MGSLGGQASTVTEGYDVVRNNPYETYSLTSDAKIELGIVGACALAQEVSSLALIHVI